MNNDNFMIFVYNAIIALFAFFVAAPMLLNAISLFTVQKRFAKVMVDEGVVKEETVRRLYSVRLRQNEEVKRERVASGMTENVGGDGTVKKRPTKVVKVGRNDLCPCGSGLKWKKCTCKEYHPDL